MHQAQSSHKPCKKVYKKFTLLTTRVDRGAQNAHENTVARQAAAIKIITQRKTRRTTCACIYV